MYQSIPKILILLLYVFQPIFTERVCAFRVPIAWTELFDFLEALKMFFVSTSLVGGMDAGRDIEEFIQ